MAKRRNLKGIPNSLVQQYFSTLFYRDGGYMEDWVWHTADEQGITVMEIDIIRGYAFPHQMGIKPIVAQLPGLRQTILRTLKSAGFPENFITEAKLAILISPQMKASKAFTCQCIMVDREGRTYEGKIYRLQSLQVPGPPHHLQNREQKPWWKFW